MRFKDLTGKYHTIDISKYKYREDRKVSQYHARARKILKKMYPQDIILEEITMPGEHLYLDFFIPSRDLCIEVQGEQHYSFSSKFHKNKMEFFQGLRRDQRKRQWCEINSLTLVCLPYNETDEQWYERIQQS